MPEHGFEMPKLIWSKGKCESQGLKTDGEISRAAVRDKGGLNVTLHLICCICFPQQNILNNMNYPNQKAHYGLNGRRQSLKAYHSCEQGGGGNICEGLQLCTCWLCSDPQCTVQRSNPAGVDGGEIWNHHLLRINAHKSGGQHSTN